MSLSFTKVINTPPSSLMPLNEKFSRLVREKLKEVFSLIFDILIAQNRATQIKSVNYDMNAAYPSMVRKYLPNADLSQVMKNFTHDILRAVKAKSLQLCKDRISKRQKSSKPRKKTF